MEYQVQFKQVEAQVTAVGRRRAGRAELSKVVPASCGEGWNYIRSAQLARPGRNLALYLDGEIHLECGAEVGEPFICDDNVVCSSTPAGPVATAVHMGPYHLLGEAHAAICRWCSDNGYRLAGPCWEVYGHWVDDPAKLRTDVFYLLKAQESIV